jgi:gamma-glutamylcysteine synthetase
MVGVPLPELQHLPVAQQYLTENDLRDHITGIKPEMLLKPNLLLEFRAADLGPTPQHWLALAAFWTGIFYDPKAFKAAEEYVATWTAEERKFIRQQVAKDGLNTKHQNINVAKVAEDLLAISSGGLKNIEPAAVGMLDILHTQISEVATPASKILAEFQQNKGDMVTTLQQNLLLASKSKKALQSMS